MNVARTELLCIQTICRWRAVTMESFGGVRSGRSRAGNAPLLAARGRRGREDFGARDVVRAVLEDVWRRRILAITFTSARW